MGDFECGFTGPWVLVRAGLLVGRIRMREREGRSWGKRDGNKYKGGEWAELIRGCWRAR